VINTHPITVHRWLSTGCYKASIRVDGVNPTQTIVVVNYVAAVCLLADRVCESFFCLVHFARVDADALYDGVCPHIPVGVCPMSLDAGGAEEMVRDVVGVDSVLACVVHDILSTSTNNRLGDACKEPNDLG
jgi:hypothetical protein